MSVRIIGKLPADNGKQIRNSHSSIITIEETLCECGREASTYVEGERDSFGFEVLTLCDECLKQVRSETDDYLDALDVEDRAPPAGYVFVVLEGTNYDSLRSWHRKFTSFRAASAFYRRAEEGASGYGGLYPNNGIREMPEDEAVRIFKRIAEAERRAIEEEMRYCAD